MQPEKLIYMINQIAAFFKTQPQEGAIDGVALHVNSFWEPRMRRQFFTMIENGTEGFDPLVLAAADKINRPQP